MCTPWRKTPILLYGLANAMEKDIKYVVFCGDKYTAEMNQNKDKNAYTGPVPFHRFKLLLFDLLVCCASVRNSKSFQLGTVNYSIHSYDFN